MKKLRIAVWHNLPSGGGKRQLFNHVKGLLERGHYIESWCPDTADQSYLPLDKIIKEHIIPLGWGRDKFNAALRPLSVVKKLVKALEDHCRACADEINKGGFDVLFANACMFLRTTPIADFVKVPSAIYLGEPYRWFYEAMPELPWIAPYNFFNRTLSLHSLHQYLTRQAALNGIRVQARAELEYAKKFDLILTNSVFTRETILRTYNLESKVCYLGINTDYYKPTGEQKENFIVGLGTIYYGKGIDRAIKAVGAIDAMKRPDLIWIGNGAPKRELMTYELLARELEVKFIPRINISDKEVVSLLSKAKAMIYTSRLEPFGLAPLEANACGTPVVGIAEGGVKETIRDGVNGFLAHDDDPKALADLLTKYLDDLQLVHEMGMRAREYVKSKWNMQMCTDNIESFLSNLSKQVRSGKIVDQESLVRIQPTGDIRMNVDELSISKNRVSIKGWAFINDNSGAKESKTYLIVKNGTKIQLIKTIKEKRTDVTEYFGNNIDYTDSGFTVDSPICYTRSSRLGILIIRNEKTAFEYIKRST